VIIAIVGEEVIGHVKLVIVVVQDRDAAPLLDALTLKEYRATRLASTGGFLKAGNTTLLIGTSDSNVDEVTSIIKETCRAREKLVTPLAPVEGAIEAFAPQPVEVVVGGALIFVMDVEQTIHV